MALGAAIQAGILEGQVSDVMVMDVWQASLMRAIALRQLKNNPDLAGIRDKYDLSEAGVRWHSVVPSSHRL